MSFRTFLLDRSPHRAHTESESAKNLFLMVIYVCEVLRTRSNTQYDKELQMLWRLGTKATSQLAEQVWEEEAAC